MNPFRGATPAFGCALMLFAGLALTACSSAGYDRRSTPSDAPPTLYRATAAPAAATAAVPAPLSAGKAAVALTASDAPAPPRYTFDIGDEFDLRVPDAPQFDQTLKVRPDGKVSMALIGTVYVQGRTPDDVQAEIAERLKQLAGPAGSREYLLQPNDEIEIKLPYYPTLNEVMRIRPDGKIQLQLVGAVQAEGLSPEELQTQLHERYAHWLKVPEVSVIVRSVTTQNIRVGKGTGRAGLSNLQPEVIARTFQAPQIFVGGEVARPGVLAYRPGLSLVQALVEAGGHLPTADATQLVVLRRTASGGVEVINPALRASYLRYPDHDVPLRPSDIVVLPKSDIATLGDKLNQYVFNILPFVRNSSFGFSYNLHNPNSNTTTTIAAPAPAVP
jgi:polysaccharide export outer membrane protein